MLFNAVTLKPSKWRSSHTFLTFTIILAIFTDSFLYGFVVPILSYMFEVRLHQPRNMTQRFITAMMTSHGLVACAFAPVIGHFADKTLKRRTPMLIALAVAIVGTGLVASTVSIEALFIGRVLQAIAGCAAWIVGFASLSENVGDGEIGQVMGTATTFVSAATISGPMISGPLLQLLGYWPTWMVPLIVLIVAFTTCWLLIDQRGFSKTDYVNSVPSDTNSVAEEAPGDDTERTSLLPKHQTPNLAHNGDHPVSFYRTMLGNVGVLACLSNQIMCSALTAGFSTTVPLHLRNTFRWNTSKTGLIFLALQVPSLCFGTLIGRLRDRVGVRYPTAFAWMFMGPVLIILGIPGDAHFSWINARINGEALYVCTLVVVGILFAFVRGAGLVQLLVITKDMELKDPTRFGSCGGRARVFSLTEIAFSVGCWIGPLISGSLVEAIGYFYMNVTLGSICLSLACLAFLTF